MNHYLLCATQHRLCCGAAEATSIGQKPLQRETFHYLFFSILVTKILIFILHKDFLSPDLSLAIKKVRRRSPFLALLLLASAALMANAPAFALAWNGDMEPLAQYRTYCQTYGDRDPGCATSLGGKAVRSIGIDRVDAGQATLGMALMVHRQVVDDLVYRADREDRWEVLGTPGRGMAGDCDDVVMTTIARLLRRGYPRAALRATIVRLPANGGYHLILSVRRQGGSGVEEIFLDDRHHLPMRPEQLAAEGYVFIAQEVPGRRHWQRAVSQPALMVAERERN
ncbi:hypothetical protein CHU95_08485 [Niveispirillum lacus]|uniref:Transglutaminase n=1 Tax=Niveispirillum lacus TaxID=1981099 RepID=A0A255Z175_9PROT|nr:transglutaminase-like cysteine peptidase [Niveispirillum lacus]OYQ35253.1 hypothetical protein CHU95_08485 [Niveispirillum lacus]